MDKRMSEKKKSIDYKERERMIWEADRANTRFAVWGLLLMAAITLAFWYFHDYLPR